MAAGHLVLVSLLFLAFSAEAAMSMSTTSWGITSGAVVVGVSLLSLLELFVAFLQAYVFTFLSALFIDSVLHHH
jgi:F-type H+-transporting ATPase subunit a